ncbi:MAG: hypothetical protein D6711_08990 [Chloroflexi bacterium]|nr:MAG: hypothetical protein D6711_08990 [Chloroflexota bacterium]
MKRLIRRLSRRNQVGQSLVILALGMIALLGFVGLTTDISILFVRYSQLRRAVDSASIAAAGQMRQDRSIATVSLTARQYIEFHGLNPREVWVETCHNQPRPDRDSGTAGLQHGTPEYESRKATLEAAIADYDAQVAAGTSGPALQPYIDAVDNAYTDYLDYVWTSILGGVNEASQVLIDARNAYNDALAAYNADPTAANREAMERARRSYRDQLDREAILFDDQEICTGDQRKLVRVTAQIESPTVFLRLLGWDTITLQASAISETAVMDVVLILDVSESMLSETTYDDWATVNLGTAYIPPRLSYTNPTSDYLVSAHNNTVLGRMVADGWLPVLNLGGTQYIEFGLADTTGNRPYTTGTGPYQAPPDGAEDWYYGWYWGTYLLGVWPEQVNNRLHYLQPGQNIGGTPLIDTGGNAGPTNDPLTNNRPGDNPDYPNANDDPRGVSNEYYQVRSFVPQSIRDNPDFNGANQGHPRPMCRVRFYPFSMVLEIPDYLAELYTTDPNIPGGVLTNSDWPLIENWDNPGSEQAQWAGFVPTYNFYGCCNDPSSARVNRNGEFIIAGAANPDNPSASELWINQVPVPQNDNDFSDLICQPFKQAKDATRLFLERIDFLRGDRVAFVTFDRTAFIIDPDGANGIPGSDVNLNHMIETLDDAINVLNKYIGVRTEPNFYVWNEDGGGWVPDVFAAGIDFDTGSPVVLEYNKIEPTVNFDDPAFFNYPALGSCFIQNAELPYPYSRYASRNPVGYSGYPPDTQPALFNVLNPPLSDSNWNAIRNSFGIDTPPEIVQSSYEKHAACRGTNIGAALREANNALTNPTTSRREGTVWVMILLSDGAAGASDPVRSFGTKRIESNPYAPVLIYDWRERNNSDFSITDGDGASVGRYGNNPGDYGAFGLCPYGNLNRHGELFDGELFEFPFCSDSDPITRHFCLTDERVGNTASRTVGWNIEANRDPLTSFGPGFSPGSLDRDYRFNIWSGDQASWDAAVTANGGVWPDYDATYCPYTEGCVPPMPSVNDYPSQNQSLWIQQQNVIRGNIFEVDLGDIFTDNNNSCDPLYDVDDYARDWADFVGGVDEVQGDDAVLPTIFTIGFGLQFENSTGTCDSSDPALEDCLGEELLRYIADVGDNFQIDNDYQQDYRDNRELSVPPASPYLSLDGSVEFEPGGWGPKDPCESENYTWRGPVDSSGNPIDVNTAISQIETRTGGESCGNYYNAPGAAELELVFDDIASRMFTRLAG